MMGYRAPSKKAIKDAIEGIPNKDGVVAKGLTDFWSRVQETSMFGPEAKVPGENTVVGPDAYNSRKWYGTLTVDAAGQVVKVK